MESPRILVVGFGSVGRRHAQNLARRGARIGIVETRVDRRDAPEGIALDAAYGSIEDALKQGTFPGAVIATPTAFHVEQTRLLLDAGCHVLLEKPVALDLRSSQSLAQAERAAARPILMGYTWRWWPALAELRARLKRGAIGRPLRAELVMASHLEDWHPGEPLTEFFMSSADLGGGALLDESHWIDQMLWLFGAPSEIAGTVERISSLPIDSDDHVELLAHYSDGLRAHIHLDLYTRPTERSIAIFGEAGALKWNFDGNAVCEWDQAGQAWKAAAFPGVRNDMFDALAAEFLRIVAGRAAPSCTLADGLAVMRIVEAVRTSQREGGRRVAIDAQAAG